MEGRTYWRTHLCRAGRPRQHAELKAHIHHCTRDASRDRELRCQDHHPAAIAPRPPPRDPRLIGRGARLRSQLPRRNRRWLSDTADPLIGAVDSNSGLTQCRRWRTCWTGSRRGGDQPALQPRKTARWRKRSMRCWNCAVMSKSFRRSNCQKASVGTDELIESATGTRSGRANSAGRSLARLDKVARRILR